MGELLSGVQNRAAPRGLGWHHQNHRAGCLRRVADHRAVCPVFCRHCARWKDAPEAPADVRGLLRLPSAYMWTDPSLGGPASCRYHISPLSASSDPAFSGRILPCDSPSDKLNIERDNTSYSKSIPLHDFTSTVP